MEKNIKMSKKSFWKIGKKQNKSKKIDKKNRQKSKKKSKKIENNKKKESKKRIKINQKNIQ